jgi:proteasome-associated ATPase
MNRPPISFMHGSKPRPSLNEMTPAELRDRVSELEEGLRQVADNPRDMAAVVESADGKVTLNLPGGMKRASAPAHLAIEAGMVVELSDKQSVIGVLKNPPSCGVIATVLRVADPARRWVMVQLKGDPAERIAIYLGKPPREDDQVLLDMSLTVIVENLGKKKSELEFQEDTGVSWDDIGGQEKAKRELREAIEEPFTHQELYRAMGKKPTKGILLHGPPGLGKTMLFKAVATALAKMHGASARSGGLISVKGPEVLSHWQGMSEAGIRGLFSSARAFYRDHKYPPVIAIDEADAIFGKRGRAGVAEGAERTIVPQLLAEMDGMGEMNAVVILATNRPDVLDPAVVRDGRIDRKIELTRPTREDVVTIVTKALGGRKLQVGAVAAELGEQAAKLVFEDKRALAMLRMKVATDDRRIVMADFVSGAMCAGIAERTVQHAIRRAIAGSGADGIGPDDVVAAVADTRDGLAGIDHETEIRGVVESYPHGSVKAVEPVSRSAA